jgi:hypothetical protein
MARTEAPASSESRRQQQLTTPAVTAPLLDSTIATISNKDTEDRLELV